MQFGVLTFSTDESMDPGELAAEVEAHGFESLFLPEHTHIPASRRSPAPGGGELPREYQRTHDPFVALAFAAANTSTLRLGFGVCLLVERDPIITAKAVASLDQLSQGRVIFGVAAGWNREEMRHHGTDPAARFDILRERVLAMREIWNRPEAAFDGEHVAFEALWSWPKPVQAGGPPILVGGSGDRAHDDVLAYGDGWLPIGWRQVDQLPAKIERLHRRAAAAGAPRPSVTIYGALPQVQRLGRYAELDVDRCLFTLPSAGRDEVLATLDERRRLVDALRARGMVGAEAR